MNNYIYEITSQEFDEQVIKSNIPVALYFYSDDCPPCASFRLLFNRIAERYESHIKFIKIHRQQNRELAEKYNIKSSPTLIFFKDGKEVCARLNGYITKPEVREAVENIIGGACPGRERSKVYCDVLILGGGPAGLSAAIYAARAKLFTVVIDEGMVGGQVATTFHVANYPGTNGVVRGVDLVENMARQAVSFGAQIDDLKEVYEINIKGNKKHIKSEDTDYYAKSLIIATGAEPRKLPADGEREFRGRGIHYCATCDGAMYQDANVLVVGGGNSAVEEAVFLTRYAKHVTIIHQHDHFQASKAAQEEALKNPNISVIWDSEIRKINGDNFVKGIIVENLKTKEKSEMEAEGVFVYIGMQPKTALLKNLIKLNEYGYILTDEDMKTNIPGVFAAGDAREKKVRQIATAVGDGVIAGIMAEKYVNGR